MHASSLLMMRPLLELSLQVLFLVLSFATATVADSKSTTNHTWSTTSRAVVHIPIERHNPDGEDHVAAGFGYGGTSTSSFNRGSISAYVKYVDDTLCQPLYYTALMNNKTSIPIYPPEKNEGKDQKRHHAPFMLMVNRGDCTFVTKVRMAQQMGAAGLIIADNQCLCHDKNCTDAYGKDKIPCQADIPHVEDDGSAGDISIPSWLLNKDTSEKLKVDLKDHDQPVMMEFTWGLPDKSIMEGDDKDHDQPHFSYHLWTTAYDEEFLDLETYQHFRTLTTTFEDYIKFSPRYAIVDGTHFKCPNQPEDGACHNLCTNHGRYCSAQPPRDDISGRAVVNETLRRLCIWAHYGEDEKTHKTGSTVWWDYVTFHMEHCANPKNDDGTDYFSDDKCIKDAYKHSSVDETVIDDCMKYSGGVDDDVINTLLEEQLDKIAESSVVSVPAVTVNHKYVLDEPNSFHLFDAMCMHYYYAAEESGLSEKKAMKKVPHLCAKCYSCENKIGCVEHGGKCVGFDNHSSPSKGSSAGGGGDESGTKKKKGKGRWMMIFIVTCFLVGGVWYYKKQNEDEFGASGGGGGILNGYLQLGQGE